MAEFTSYSQAGQDRFAYEVLGRKTDGTFLDVGAGHVIEKNNSYGLEQVGWRGLCVDLAPQGDVKKREAFLTADATKVPWFPVLCTAMLWPEIDYLSLDVDAATVDALKSLPLSEVRFCVATIENDMYRFGPGPRDIIRSIMGTFGYHLLCSNVCSLEGLPFEEWYIAQDLAKSSERFKCDGKRCNEIFRSCACL